MCGSLLPYKKALGRITAALRFFAPRSASQMFVMIMTDKNMILKTQKQINLANSLKHSLKNLKSNNHNLNSTILTTNVKNNV